MILAGDVGGTNTRLGLFRMSKARLQLVALEKFSSRDYDALETIISIFLENREPVAAACFGVAGPVMEGTAMVTNLAWTISEKSLKRFLSVRPVTLVNDLVANAYGIGALPTKDYVTLNKGKKDPEGNAGLLSAGTGLGASILFWNGSRYIPCPSEGGHVEFGPRNRLELEMLNYLFDEFGHVSYERVISGPGLVNIYRFLKHTGKFGNESAVLTERFEQEDPAAVIAETALLAKNKLCAKALDLFVSIYGAAAGDLALHVMATGGIYIGGGIAPKIIDKLKDGTFMNAFKDKGRLSHIVEPIPVKVIMNERAGLYGAAVCAERLLTEEK